jgi:predicted GIY-YIG superfamily endonuclease
MTTVRSPASGDKKCTEAWMASKQPAVYIMGSHERGTLYVGVTGNLRLRAWEHRDGVVEGFTKRYGVKQLVWFEFHPDFPRPSRARRSSRNGIAPGSWN